MKAALYEWIRPIEERGKGEVILMKFSQVSSGTSIYSFQLKGTQTYF